MAKLIVQGLRSRRVVIQGYRRDDSGPSPTPLSLREACCARLASSTALTAIVGPRVYFGALPESAPLPAITYSVVSRTGDHTLSGASGISDARIQVSAWAYTQAEADQLAQAVYHRFDGYRGDLGGLAVLACLWQSEIDLPQPPRAGTDRWVYQVASDYSIKHRVPPPSDLT